MCINRTILFVTKRKLLKPPGALFNNLWLSSPCPHPAQLQAWLQAPQCGSIPHSPYDPGSHPMTMKLHFAEEVKETQSQESHLRPFVHSFYPLQIVLTEPVLSALPCTGDKGLKKHKAALMGFIPLPRSSSGSAVGKEETGATQSHIVTFMGPGYFCFHGHLPLYKEKTIY